MKLVDLTLGLEEKTTVFPGLPSVKLSKVWTLDKQGWNVNKLEFPSHMDATHMDAPYHKVKNGKKLDEFPVNKFVGKGVLVDCRGKKELGKEVLKNTKLRKGDFVLFYADHLKYFGTKKYSKEQPYLNVKLAKELAKRKVGMVLVDFPSVDVNPWAVHPVLLKNKVLVVENVANMNLLLKKKFKVFAFPLKVNLDGAPCRVVAQLNSESRRE